MIVRYPVLIFILILISCAIPQILQTGSQLQPLKTKAEVGSNLVYPGEMFKFEKLEYSTFDNKSKMLYVGTSPNGHILGFNINDEDPIAINELGIIPNDPMYDLNMNKQVYALVNDSKYLYGGTSDYVSLFFRSINSRDEKKTTFRAFGHEILRNANVYMLRSAKIVSDENLTYIVIAALCSDSKGKLIVWRVNNLKGPTINDKISIVEVDDGIEITQIGLTLVNNDVVAIMGTTNNKLYIYNLAKSLMLDSKHLNHNTSSIIADEEVPGRFWVISRKKIHTYAIDKQMKILDSYSIPRTIKWYEDHHVVSTYHNYHIYTSSFRFNTRNGSFNQYQNNFFPQSAFFNISVAYKSSTEIESIFTFVGGPYFTPVRFYKLNNTESLKLNVNSSFIPLPRPYTPPYGGSPYTGLAAYDGIIYGSSAKNGTLFLYDLVTTLTEDESLVEGVQAGAILPFDEKLYFGMYSRPYFNWRTKGSNGEWGKKVYDLQPIIKDPNQVRIKSLAGIKVQGKSLVFIGTSPGSYFHKGSSKPALLVYNPANSSQIIILGYVENANKITSLTTAHTANHDEIIVYGATMEGVFIFKYSINMPPSKPVIIKQTTDLSASAVMVANNSLYLIEIDGNTELFKYDKLPLSNSEFKMKSASIELWRWSMYSGGQLVEGNDGNIYANIARGISKENKYYNYVYKITPDLKHSEVIIENAGVFDSNEIVNLMAVDPDKSNKDIYFGFRGGQLKKY